AQSATTIPEIDESLRALTVEPDCRQAIQARRAWILIIEARPHPIRIALPRKRLHLSFRDQRVFSAQAEEINEQVRLPVGVEIIVERVGFSCRQSCAHKLCEGRRTFTIMRPRGGVFFPIVTVGLSFDD